MTENSCFCNHLVQMRLATSTDSTNSIQVYVVKEKYLSRNEVNYGTDYAGFDVDQPFY